MKKISNSNFILDYTVSKSIKGKIKDKFKICQAIIYKFGMNGINMPITENKKYNVSICAIFKNEARYLKEWIEFNQIVGVDHFYLYNNNSEDDYYTVLQPYIQSGVVTLNQWTKNQAQMECYKDCIMKYKSDTKWIGFIDIDEFIVPIDTNNIYDFLRPFEKNRGSVKIYWKMFGSSGMVDRDYNSLVTESLVVSWPKYYSVGKCFYNTSFDFDFDNKKNYNLHHMLWTTYKGKSIPPVNAYNNVCLDNVNLVKKGIHPIQINHYFSKSFTEYAYKKTKGDVFFKNNPHDEAYFYLHESENISTDYTAYKYMIKLKLKMGITK